MSVIRTEAQNNFEESQRLYDLETENGALAKRVLEQDTELMELRKRLVVSNAALQNMTEAYRKLQDQRSQEPHDDRKASTEE